jgi:hypothetical protein
MLWQQTQAEASGWICLLSFHRAHLMNLFIHIHSSGMGMTLEDCYISSLPKMSVMIHHGRYEYIFNPFFPHFLWVHPVGWISIWWDNSEGNDDDQ